MQNYSQFPPIQSFKSVLRTCPQTALVFATLWNQKSDQKKVSIRRDDIEPRLLISPTIFKNYLISLGRLELLSFKETPEIFHVSFLDKNEN